MTRIARAIGLAVLISAAAPSIARATAPAAAGGAQTPPKVGATTDAPYLLRRGTEVAMLWTSLAKRRFSPEAIACDFMVERNFERDQPLFDGADYSCESMDEFKRHDRIAAAAPAIQAEYDALAREKVLRILMVVPIQEYDFARKGFPTGLADKSQPGMGFKTLPDTFYFLLENAGMLDFVRMAEGDARALTGGPFWLFDLTIRATGAVEKPFTAASNLRLIKARIVSARIFTTADGSFSSGPTIVSAAQPQDAAPVLELSLDAAPRARR